MTHHTHFLCQNCFVAFRKRYPLQIPECPSQNHPQCNFWLCSLTTLLLHMSTLCWQSCSFQLIFVSKSGGNSQIMYRIWSLYNKCQVSVKAVHALLSENSCLHRQSSTSCPAWIWQNHGMYMLPDQMGGEAWPGCVQAKFNEYREQRSHDEIYTDGSKMNESGVSSSQQLPFPEWWDTQLPAVEKAVRQQHHLCCWGYSHQSATELLSVHGSSSSQCSSLHWFNVLPAGN